MPHIDPLHETRQGDGIDVDAAVVRTSSAPAMSTLRDPDGNGIVSVEVSED